MVDTKDLLSRFSSEEVLELMYSAGFKEPNKLKFNSKGWVTIRCSEHADEENKSEGKRASCNVHPESTNFACKSCGHKGNLFDVAKVLSGSNNFIDALKYLADIKGYDLDRPAGQQRLKPIQQKPREKEEQKIKYFGFDPSRPVVNYTNEEIIEGYMAFDDLMKYKAIMTVLMRHSLEVDQSKKIDFLCNKRMIDQNNPRLSKVGYLPMAKDDREFWHLFERTFPIEDLIRFGLYRSASEKYNPMSWKYKDLEMVVFPNQDLYSDLFHGAMLRPLEQPSWSTAKELQLTQTRLINPIPFALSREVLMSSEPLIVTEGSVDGLSTDKDFSANPGINVYYKPYLGLYRGKKVLVGYDMDQAGLRATFGYEAISVNRSKRDNKKTTVTHLYANTDKGKADAMRFKRRIARWVKKDFSSNCHNGLLKDLMDAGVDNPGALLWDASLGKDFNELRKRHGGQKKEFFSVKRLDI